MEGLKDNLTNIYTSTLSKKSVQTIAKHFINEELSDSMSQIIAEDVRENISKIVVIAAKNARRTLCDKVEMEHLLFAMKERNVSLNLVHVDFDWPDVKTNEKKSEPREERQKQPETAQEQELQSKEEPDIILIKSSITDNLRTLRDAMKVPKKWQKSEKVLLMANKTFPLSKEQQAFYVKLTTTCMGTSEYLRRDALQRLTTDSSLQPILPQLSLFISEAVPVNVMQNNFALLLYLLRILDSLLHNRNINLKNYVHLLIPSVISCTVSRQLCPFPAAQNHWALREYASNIMAKIVKLYNNKNNNILDRTIMLYKNGLQSSELTTIYGSLIGLAKLGKYTIVGYVIPQLKAISEVISPYLNKDCTDQYINKQASTYIRHRVLKMCAPILKNLHKPPDKVEEYSKRYGFLGHDLCDAVLLNRLMDDVVEDAQDQKLAAFLATMDSDLGH